MRGKLTVFFFSLARKGITPAGAGKTFWNGFRSMYYEDHPRRCGENRRWFDKVKISCGSPPQVRGKRICPQTSAEGGWITPAGAGKTVAIDMLTLADEDHPRRCGENLHAATEYHNHQWITPAGAGKTVFAPIQAPHGKDHPRRCGENSHFILIVCVVVGSPPQVRGKLASVLRVRGICGITPAGAGKTGFSLLSLLRFEDHPRRCGENFDFTDAQLRGKGSPPQVRGKRRLSHLQRSQSGITPAGAGKTDGVRKRGEFAEDHPRRCGENPYVAGIVTCEAGSPPQVRGKLDRRMGAAAARRITPAGAGKTMTSRNLISCA